MTRAEYDARMSRALGRAAKVSALATLLVVLMDLVGFFGIYACAGLGIAATTGISLWFAPVISFVAGATVGQAVAWTRRARRVAAYERLADHLERTQ